MTNDWMGWGDHIIAFDIHDFESPNDKSQFLKKIMKNFMT